AQSNQEAKLARYIEAKGSRDDKLKEYTKFIMAQPAFVQTQKGLFAQVVAYDELKQSAAIWWQSAWTKLFIIFIEMAPVLAKLLFSPSSVYAMAHARMVSEAVSQSEESKLADKQRIAELNLEVDKLVQEREQRA